MEQLWLQDFKNSIQYFYMAVKISTKQQIKEYLDLASKHLELPVGNWLYCMINGVMYTNPLYNPNL